ncbi:MAG TPA: amidohydrolase family protein [Burkholderiales bacterium]|jgi:predicted TIM-barrel fold metal-dependent hydrolase
MKGSCDSHFHVFGPTERYPPRDPKLRYKPPYAPLDAYLAHARALGLERFVFVQPSAYLRDNGCMLDAMREVAGCRGVVDIDEDLPDAELAQMHALGVRGVRINVSPVHPPEPGLALKLLPRIEKLDERLAGIGWHLDFLLPGWLTDELMKKIASLRCHCTLAHMGMFLASGGVQQAGFQRLLDVLRNGSGKVWVKLTGAYRMSQAPGFADAEPMVRALIEAAPDRLIWGSDYPHLSFADQVSSQQLFDLFNTWARDESTRRRILVDNPTKLFGF